MRLFDLRDRVTQPPPPPVRVNGQEISPAEIAREIQNHPAHTPVEAREAAVRALVVRALLLQAARDRGLTPGQHDLGGGKRETEEDALVRQLLDDALDLPTPTQRECHRFYELHIARFRSPTIWEPDHILLSAPPADPSARNAARQMAMRIIDVLSEHPDQFEQLARDYSTCPSHEQGGSLGQISPGQTTPSFEAALETMEPGTLCCEPVETPYGYHVVRLVRRSPGQTLPFAAVEKMIADYLAASVFNRAVSQLVSLLAGEAQIEGVEIDRASSPLVQ